MLLAYELNQAKYVFIFNGRLFLAHAGSCYMVIRQSICCLKCALTLENQKVALIIALIPRERESKIALYHVGWLNMLEVS